MSSSSSTDALGSSSPTRGALLDLALRIRQSAREALGAALARGRMDEIARPVAEGSGDVTYGLDLGAERAVREWSEEQAREGPLSVLTEDSGWRHLGPGPGGVVELPDFDHGGPRLAVDPIDGTRHLMYDLRSAWTVLSAAGPGAGQPTLADVRQGIVAEIPDSRAARLRVVEASRGAGASLTICDVESGATVASQPLRADADDRPDHGYFTFFSFHPALRPDVARIAARFFARIERDEGADPSACYDDQLISSAGQLMQLAFGVYRMVLEARELVARRRGVATQTAKPYDMAGAILCAREAGCVVTGPRSEPLDFPIDTKTPVSFVGYANPETARRLAPHLAAVLREELG